MTTEINPSLQSSGAVDSRWQGILESSAQEVFQMMAGANLLLRAPTHREVTRLPWSAHSAE
jgi:hypothetical protein